jgi:EAL and modified HD-GYP domain-containing signal transduction protein
MCELLAEASGIPDVDRAFLVGLFSVLDAMLERPMEQILRSLPLAPDIVDAVLRRQGDLGRILRGVIEYEKRNWDAAYAAIQLNESLIQDAYRKAVAWSLTTLTGLAQAEQPVTSLAR